MLSCKLLDQLVPQFGGIGSLFLIGANEDSTLAVVADLRALFSRTDLHIGDVSDTDDGPVIGPDRKIANFFNIAKRAACFHIESACAADDGTSRHIRAANTDRIDHDAGRQTQFSEPTRIDCNADFRLW